MAALAILIALIVGLRLLISWSSRRSDEISGFYKEDEDSPVVDTLLHMNEARGNHL